MDVPALELMNIAAINNLPDGLDDVKGKALVIERFDRLSDGSLVHIEDFAQIFGVYPADKYKKASMRSIARVIAAEGTEADIVELVRRLTFNVLIGNADMHLKNWSMIYPDRRHAALAPAYDFVSTIVYLKDERAALNFSRTKRFDQFTEDELSHMAAKALLPETLVLKTARETVALFHQHWQAEKRNLPMSAELIAAIEAHLKKVPIANTSEVA
jgi:serine/threonine-protein kinase HipA